MAISDQEQSAVVGWLKGDLKDQPKKQRDQIERVARRALARAFLLGEPLPKRVRWLLWERIDCDPDPDKERFVLKPARSQGRPKTKAQDWEIAEVVERRLEAGDLMKQACQYASDKLGVSKRTAEKAHAQVKEQIRAIRKWPGAKIITRLD
jgi:hypothetical protein